MFLEYGKLINQYIKRKGKITIFLYTYFLARKELGGIVPKNNWKSPQGVTSVDSGLHALQHVKTDTFTTLTHEMRHAVQLKE